MLWIVFTLIGMRMSLLLKRRQLLLEETLTFLNSLSVEIEYSQKSIIKIIDRISCEESVKNLEFLKDCIRQMNVGADFPSAWCKAVESSRLYKREEKAKLLQLGSQLGTSDTDNQLRIIKVYSDYFQKYCLSASEDYKKYGKASSLFGMFIGAAIFVLLF